MQRKATQAVTLKDGNVIPKGAACVVSMDIMSDPKVYPEPEKFNPYRFLAATSDVGDSDKYKFISPDPTYLGFGYGKHACPGRFFAVNELKIAMCYLLMLYEWKFPHGPQKPAVVAQAVINKKDPKARVLYRRRPQGEKAIRSVFWSVAT